MNKNESQNGKDISLCDIEKLNSDNEFVLNSVKREIKSTTNIINKSKNIYNNFCMKTINYLKRNNYLKDYKESIPDENSPMFHCAKIFKTLDDEKTKYLINTLKNSVLLSLYFNQYKYLLNLLSFEEIKNLYENELNIETFRKREEKTISVTKELVEKILEKESILELKEELKEIQKYYNLFLFFTLTMIKKKEFIKYYQSINFLRDFSFCSKMYIYYNFAKLNNKNYNFIEDLYPF